MSKIFIDFDHVDENRETKHAEYIIFDSDFPGVSHYLPKSQITIDHKKSIVEMPEWLAKDKGLV